MPTFILPNALDANGDPVNGALAKVYLADGTTPATTYSDEAMTTPNAWPIVYSAAGTPGACYVAEGEYKLDLQTSAGVSLDGYPKDDIAVFAFPVGVAAGGTGAITGPTLPIETIYTTGTAQTHTTATGCRRMVVEMIGGGGGGGGVANGSASNSGAAGSGGGGGYVRHVITNPESSFTYTVGAGGAGGSAGANNGSDGTASTWADGVSVALSAGGGAGGTAVTATTGFLRGVGGSGGASSGGDTNITGDSGLNSTAASADIMSFPVGGAGFYGRRKSLLAQSTDGEDAVDPGGGGTGANSVRNAVNKAGGDGLSGLIRVTEYV